MCVQEGYNRCSRLGQKAAQIMVGVVPGLEKQKKLKTPSDDTRSDSTSRRTRAGRRTNTVYGGSVNRGPAGARYRGVTQHCMPGTRTDY